MAEQYWDRLASGTYKKDITRLSWGGINQIARNHNYLITNNPDYYWIDYFKQNYFSGGQAGHTLALGCGEGYIERLFKERGFQFTSLTGMDVSEKCISAAEQRAREAQLAPLIHYQVADLNAADLSGEFDFIFFFHSLHHVNSLEKLLDQCARVLRPSGILMVNEYVGPSRFQWTDEQLKAANALSALLPEELRFDLVTQTIRREITRPSVEQMMQDDESEAIRSAEIERCLKERFFILEEKNWGGTLTNLIFQHTAGNFDPTNHYHNSIAELLIHHENAMIEKGILPSDFKFFVARSKTGMGDISVAGV